MLIAEKTGEQADALLHKLTSAARLGQLATYGPGSLVKYVYGNGVVTMCVGAEIAAAEADAKCRQSCPRAFWVGAQ